MTMEVTSETFGQRLRKQREGKGLTLEDISKATRIPVRHLAALETGDESHLPAAVYVKGFLRAYARELDMDDRELIDEYNKIYGLEPDKFKIRVTTVPKQSSYILPLFIIALLAAVVLVVGVYYFFNRQKGSAPLMPPSQISDVKPMVPKSQAEPIPAVSSEKSEPVEVSEQETEQSLELAETPAAPQQSTPETTVAAQPEPLEQIKVANQEPEGELLSQDLAAVDETGEHTLKVDVLEETWIRIFIDGQTSKQYLLKPGESLSWRAKKYFKLKIGNAGGIKLFFDGEALPLLGEPGQVKEVVLPKSENNT